MKSKIVILSLAATALTLGLLGSCSKLGERVDDLETRVDVIESNLNSINSSIADLGVIRQQVQNLIVDVTGPGALSKLKEADKTLAKRIEQLEKLLEGGTIPVGDIEQLTEVVEGVEEIGKEVENLGTDVENLGTDVENLGTDVASIDTRLVNTIQALEGAIADLESMETNVAGIDAELTQQIIDAKGELNSSVQELKDNLEAMIKTVAIIPAYRDGSIEALEDTVAIEFMIEPASAVAAIDKNDISVLVNEVKVKGLSEQTAPITEFSKNAVNGTVSIKAAIAEFIPSPESKKELTLAVRIAGNGLKFTTDFAPVTLTYNDVQRGVFTVGPGPDGIFGTDDDAKVRFFKGDLWYRESDNSWHIEDNQYDKLLAFNREHLGFFYYYTDKTRSKFGTENYQMIQEMSSEMTSKEEKWAKYKIGFLSELDTTLTDGTRIKDSLYTHNVNWGEAYGSGYTLSTKEWATLLSFDSDMTQYLEGDELQGKDFSNDVREGKYRMPVKVNNVKGVMLVPDDWTDTIEEEYSLNEWKAAEKAGAVFLPASGIVPGKSHELMVIPMKTAIVPLYEMCLISYWCSDYYENMGAMLTTFSGDIDHYESDDDLTLMVNNTYSLIYGSVRLVEKVQ